MKKFPLIAEVKQGIPEWYNKQEKLNIFRLFEGKKVIVTIQEFRNQRSLKQNSFYWGYIIPKCCEGFRNLGWDIDEDGTHEEFKKMFLLKDVVNKKTGEIKKIPMSTSKLKTDTFETEFLDKIKRFAAEELQIPLNDPDPFYKTK